MMTVVSIVEGAGEVEALPVLLRRLAQWIDPRSVVEIQRPIPVKRNRFLKFEDGEEFDRILRLAALKSGENGWILILIDADDDCPADLGNRISRAAARIIPHRNLSVVLANREFEAWFIAGALSLAGQRGFTPPQNMSRQPESIRGAKEWMGANMAGGKYRETMDQPAFSARVDLQMVCEHSRSFRKLCSEWIKNIPNNLYG